MLERFSMKNIRPKLGKKYQNKTLKPATIVRNSFSQCPERLASVIRVAVVMLLPLLVGSADDAPPCDDCGGCCLDGKFFQFPLFFFHYFLQFNLLPSSSSSTRVFCLLFLLILLLLLLPLLIKSNPIVFWQSSNQFF